MNYNREWNAPPLERISAGFRLAEALSSRDNFNLDPQDRSDRLTCLHLGVFTFPVFTFPESRCWLPIHTPNRKPWFTLPRLSVDKPGPASREGCSWPLEGMLPLLLPPSR
jgi:hypothetical protein